MPRSVVDPGSLLGRFLVKVARLKNFVVALGRIFIDKYAGKAAGTHDAGHATKAMLPLPLNVHGIHINPKFRNFLQIICFNAELSLLLPE